MTRNDHHATMTSNDIAASSHLSDGASHLRFSNHAAELCLRFHKLTWFVANKVLKHSAPIHRVFLQRRFVKKSRKISFLFLSLLVQRRKTSVTRRLDYFSLFGFFPCFKFAQNVKFICQSRFQFLSNTK